MAQSQEQEESVFSTPDISGRVVKIEQLWQEFFLDPSQWWDNRLMKKSPKYPDFKHKSTNEGLWIESWLNPPWVKPKIITMEVDQTKFDGGSRSRVAYFGGDASKLCQDGQLKEALQIVEHMVHQSIRAPIKVYACLLQGCTRMKALAEGKRVHALIVQSGFESDMFLGNTLVNMYAKCGNLLDARQVFNKMPEHNVFSWTAIISAYANQGQGEEAINLFKKMQKTGIAPDKVMFVFVLKACASMSALAQGKQLHTQIIESGLELDVFVGSALVDMYAKCGSIEHARQVFNNMQERNVVSWTTMIAGCVQQGLCREALTLFQQMQHEGMKPDKVTFASVLKACASLAALEQGKQVHAQIIKLGFELDTFVGSALVNMYAKCGYIEAACQVFERISKRDLVSWNIMIAGYAQQGLGKKALTLYEQMKKEGVQPDNVTFVSLLKACTSLEQCKRIHAHIARSGVQLNVFVGNTLVDMYSKLESIDDARQVFNKMHELNVITVRNNK
ncbi:hypothetical protein O6H91_Y458200 [Diphasiastrum complanatum]|nr:hypothetical protein O6H91_Y458200 [Diphasiastrum complanatum]